MSGRMKLGIDEPNLLVQTKRPKVLKIHAN